jgi:hypothetical protein
MLNSKSRNLYFLLLFGLLSIYNLNFSFAQNYTLSKKDTSDIQYLDGKKYFILKIDKNETLYSISKRFNVSQDELIKINPWVKDGLKANKKIWIPATSTSVKKGADKEEVKDKSAKQLYTVGVFLPLNLAGSNYDPVMPDSLQLSVIDKETLAQLHFYEGLEYAIDTLVNKNCKIQLKIFDTGSDTFSTSLLMKEWRLKDLDFIISQNTSPNQKIINRYSLEHHIPLFTFYLNATDIIKDNPQAYALQPSSNLQCKEGGKFAAERFKNVNVFAIKTTSKENERAVAFQNGWSIGNVEAKPKIIDYASLDSNIILKALVKGKNNVVFVASSNEDVVNPLLLTLITHKEEYEFTVMGLPTWQYFESIDVDVLEKLNTHIFSASQYNKPEILRFRNRFRKDYFTEPLDAAFQGYDLMMLIGKNFMGKKQPDKKDYHGIFSNYIFQETKNGAFENNFISMMKYKDAELVEVR